MAKPTFKLRKAKNNSAGIQFIFQYGKNKRLRYATGFQVKDIKNWDEKRMQIKNVVEELDRININNKLSSLENTVIKTYNRWISENITVNNDMLKDVCDEFLGKKEIEVEPEKIELLKFFDWFIEFYQKNPLMSTSKTLGSGTAKTYRNALRILKTFNNERKYKLVYEKVGIKFYQDYLEWLQSQSYSNNYIGAQIKILKTIMNASLELDYHSNREHLKKYFKKPVEVINHIYLSENELNKIHEFDLSKVETIKINEALYLNSKKLEHARDLFLISANTALRVSDFNRLNEKNIVNANGQLMIQIVTKKTKTPVTIPLKPQVKKIFDKYNGKPPKSMPEQHINYAIKEVARLAELNEIVTIERTIGGNKVKTDYKKYELITNHTARRSFCTNAYLAGVPAQSIMEISGHKSEKIFYNYIKASDMVKAINTAKHPFFS